MVVEALYLLVMYYFFIFGFYLYFGSGAGASSSTAEVAATVAITSILLFPIIFNIYKTKVLLKVKAGDSYAYLISTLILILALICIFCHTNLPGSL